MKSLCNRVAVVFLLGLAVLAISPTNSAAQEDDGKRPLVWGADAEGGVPYLFKNDQGELDGFEKEIVDELGEVLGCKIIFKPYEFKHLVDGITGARKDFDFALNGLEITPRNQQKVRFTKPYYLYQLQLVVRNQETRVRTLEDCKKNNLVVGTLEGSAAELLLDHMEVAKEAFPAQEENFDLLRQGRRIQAVLLDLPIALYYAVPDKDIKYSLAGKYRGLKLAGPPFAEGYYGIAVHKDNEKLAHELDAALDTMRKNGSLKRILRKWELWNADQYRLFGDEAEAGKVAEMPFAVYFPMLLAGAVLTIEITVLSFIVAVVLGLAIAVARLYGPAPLRLLAVAYVEFFRGIPVLFLLFFLYFGMSSVISLEPLTAAVIAFGLNYAAYESEIYRAGISSIPHGQWEAAASLGMPPALTFRRIILPQAIRVILPPMTNDLVALFKDTSVVSIIALVELSKQYQILTRSGADYVGIGLTTAALYLVMSVPLGHLSRYLEKRWASA